MTFYFKFRKLISKGSIIDSVERKVYIRNDEGNMYESFTYRTKALCLFSVSTLDVYCHVHYHIQSFEYHQFYCYYYIFVPINVYTDLFLFYALTYNAICVFFNFLH